MVEPAVVRINALDESGDLEWHGSGFVIDTSGIVVTNAHVIAGAAKCVAVFADGTKCPVTGYYSMNDKNDLAIIAIAPPDGRELVALPLSPETPQKGETVLAFGCPYGLDFTASDGIISAVRTHDEIEGLRGNPTQGEWLQTSAPISQGNSGGPLVNKRGEVVGVNAMVHRLGQNLNFSVGASEVQSELDSRSSEVASLSRDTAREDEKETEGVDLTDDPLGKEKFAQIKKLVVLPLANTGATAGRTINVFRNTARFELKAAGIEVVSIPDDGLPVLLVGIIYHGYRGARTTSRISVRAILVVPEMGDSGIPKVYTVWESEADLGATTIGGSINGRGLKRIKGFYRKFIADYESAVKAHGDGAGGKSNAP